MSHRTNTLPTNSGKRIDLLDIFRGFAVFGIFVVNIEIMNCVFVNQHAFSGQWTAQTDQLSVRLLQLFFYTKFFPIFSFLFGVGIAMQVLKSLRKKEFSAGFLIRRMAVLFLFGLLHILLLWNGDVLHLYGILGLLTILLLKVPNRFLLLGAIVLLLFPFYEQLAESVFGFLHFKPELFLEGYSSQEITQLLRSGSYLEGMQFRLLEYISNIPLLFVFFAPIAFAMFLLGLYVGRKNYVDSIADYTNSLKKPIIAIAIITNAYRLIFLFVLPELAVYQNPVYRPFFLKLMFLSDVSLGLFYLWIIAWLFRFPAWQKLLSPLKYAGRMALSNYIMHSVFGFILFSSLGFQLYETLSPGATLVIATGVFAFQLIFSKIWLKHFNYGPLEWIWRCLTYQKLLAIQKSPLPEARLA
jgi:uncharacterized protein